MDKQQIRIHMRKLIRCLPAEIHLSAAQRIAEMVAQHLIFQRATHVMLFNSLPDEVSTSPLLNLSTDIKKVYLPRVSGDDIEVVPLGTKFSTDNRYGIQEPIGTPLSDPTLLDLIIVPGVAFDHNCNRLGRGKGYYDRFLNTLQVPTIGICFHEQIVPQIPCEVHDKAMDFVITPSEIYSKK